MYMGIICVFVFLVTFFAADLIGLAIEAKSRQRWRIASDKIGLGFDPRRRRVPSLSRMLVPWVVAPGAEDSLFSYGESLKNLKGQVNGFSVVITDFAVWDFFTRCNVVFRGVLCVVKGSGLRVPGQMGLVKSYSRILHGFRLSDTFREYQFPNEQDFEDRYALFGRDAFAPWSFPSELRKYCVDHSKEIDCIWANKDQVVLLWVDHDPDRFEELIHLTVDIASQLSDELPVNGNLKIVPA
jgi:hypothetical protein